MQNGQLYLQVHWEPPTDVQGGGALPTPTASDVEGGVAKDVQYKNGHFFRENKKEEMGSETKRCSSLSSDSDSNKCETGVNSYNNKGKPLLGAACYQLQHEGLQRKILREMESGNMVSETYQTS